MEICLLLITAKRRGSLADIKHALSLRWRQNDYLFSSFIYLPERKLNNMHSRPKFHSATGRIDRQKIYVVYLFYLNIGGEGR